MTSPKKKKDDSPGKGAMTRQSSSPMKANYHGSADNAKKWMQETGMEVFINQIVNRGFVFRATNAYTFMLRELAGEMDENELETTYGIRRTEAETVRLAKEKELREGILRERSK